MSVTRVVLIRVGETQWNAIGRWQGIVAVPLNAHGIAQSRRLAKFVRNIGLTAIYSSDLRRARDTAGIISEYANVKLSYDDRLRERHMGEWQGLTINEIRDWYRGTYHELVDDPHNVPVPGGESRVQVSQRVNAFFNQVVQQENDTIGIITHTTAIRTLLAEQVPKSNPYDLHFRNLSATTITRQEDDTWRITQLDDVTHLEGMSSAYVGEVEGKQ